MSRFAENTEASAVQKGVALKPWSTSRNCHLSGGMTVLKKRTSRLKSCQRASVKRAATLSERCRSMLALSSWYVCRFLTTEMRSRNDSSFSISARCVARYRPS